MKAKVSKTGKTLKKYQTASTISLKAGKTTALKASFTKAKKTKVKKHTAIRFESSNPKVLKVSAKGRIKALKKGTARVYVFAQNGASRKVTVKVK